MKVIGIFLNSLMYGGVRPGADQKASVGAPHQLQLVRPSTRLGTGYFHFFKFIYFSYLVSKCQIKENLEGRENERFPNDRSNEKRTFYVTPVLFMLTSHPFTILSGCLHSKGDHGNH